MLLKTADYVTFYGLFTTVSQLVYYFYLDVLKIWVSVGDM